MQSTATFSPIIPALYPLTPAAGTAYTAARTLEAAQPHATTLLANGYGAAPRSVAPHAQALQSAFGSASAAADAAVPGSGEPMRAAAASMAELPEVFAKDRKLSLARVGEATFAPRVGAADDAMHKAIALLDHSPLAHSEAAQHFEQAIVGFEPVVQKLQALGATDTAARTQLLGELATLKEGAATAGSSARISELTTQLATLNRTNGPELLARIDHPGALDSLTKLATGIDMAQHATGTPDHGMRIANNLITTLRQGGPLTTGAVADGAQSLLTGSRAALANVAAGPAAISSVSATRHAAENLVATLIRAAH